jgi:hypothetical protein
MLPILPLFEFIHDDGQWSVSLVEPFSPSNRRVGPEGLRGEIVGMLVGEDLFAGVNFVFAVGTVISSGSALGGAPPLDENWSVVGIFGE